MRPTFPTDYSEKNCRNKLLHSAMKTVHHYIRNYLKKFQSKLHCAIFKKQYWFYYATLEHGTLRRTFLLLLFLRICNINRSSILMTVAEQPYFEHRFTSYGFPHGSTCGVMCI
ncbi:unnamed protein product [Spodoptera littoralis]|uniref:Uncharacterized protein n=1 Tax=Spodoptera littoralis TaxID=7109 RepID=A0A9P0IMA3_SPOLI|nr:unnamed protein product [Spodoptera littoralis]CAH1647588.1 unnamed protein product [Spodoptera littoralis]